ncbi:MAG: hypothetical protein HEEMFOPI_01766 [Holosporales bacterium]
MTIPEYKLEIKTNEQKCFKWAPQDVGKRFKIGGSPEFIQNSEYPICRCCSKKMIFYAQLDSLNDDYMIADCGLIYVFICFDCNKTESFIQSY